MGRVSTDLRDQLWEDGQVRADLEDRFLVARSQAGDSAAFESIYRRYAERIEAYMRTALKCRHEAESATQEVFVKVLEAMPSFEVTETPFRIWLFRVVRNHAINHAERHRRVTVESPAQVDARRAGTVESAETEVLTRLSDHEFMHLLKRLPQRQAQVLFLRFVVGMDVREVARTMAAGENAVRNLQHRAFKALRPRFTARGL